MFVGLAKPTVATLTDEKQPAYENAFACGEAIQIDITPTYAEGNLYGDNRQVAYDKEFRYADITLNTTRLPVEGHKVMFGHTVNEDGRKVVFRSEDDAPYIGMGFYVTERIDNKKKYVASWLYKVKMTEGAESYRTKGDNIEYQTPSLTGRAVALEDGRWKTTEVFDTEEEAKTFLANLGANMALYATVGKIDGEATVYGKTAKDLGEYEFDLSGRVSGKANYVEEYTEFSAGGDMNEGYYVPIRFQATEDVKEAQMQVVGSAIGPVKMDEDPIGNVVFLGKTEEVASQKQVAITSGEKKIVFSFTGVTFAPKE